MSIKLTKNMLKLCSGMLRHYGLMMSRKVCQDFDVSATGVDLPTKTLGSAECDEIMRLYEDFNSGGEDYDSDSWRFMNDGMVCGFAMSEVLDKIEIPSKIKMTKELPTESGWYYWKSCDYDDLVFVLYFDGNHSLFRSEMCRSDLIMIAANPEEMGGYWAKVDKDQFEFED